MFRSIRGSLQAWHAAVLAIVLAAFGSVVFHVQRQSALQQIDGELHRTAELVLAGLRRPYTGRFRQRDSQRQETPRPAGESAAPAAAKSDEAGAARPDESPRDDGRETAEARDRNGNRERNDSRERNDGRDRNDHRDGGEERPSGSPRRGEWPEPRLELSDDLIRLFEGENETYYYFVIWRNDGRVLHKSLYAKDVPLPEIRTARGEPPVRTIRQRGEYREAIHQYWFGTNILVGRSIHHDMAALDRSGYLLVLAGGGVLALGLIGGRWISGRAIRPIETISTTAAEISTSNLSRRIDLQETESELSGLAQTLNRMFDRLQAGFEQQMRFTADASHELRTPLAVILSHSELALSKNRTPEELRQSIDTCRRAALRMRSLVESLLTLSRFDSGELRLERRKFDLAHMAAECVTLVRPLAERQRIALRTDLPSTFVTGDPERLAQVVTNLLSNAIRYNREGGCVDVTVESRNGSVALRVSDTGVGIPAEHLAHIFDRFYRVDQSRSREEGGTGLGLAICKSIVEAHGGTISASSDGQTGTVFELCFPRDSENSRGAAAESDELA